MFKMLRMFKDVHDPDLEKQIERIIAKYEKYIGNKPLSNTTKSEYALMLTRELNKLGSWETSIRPSLYMKVVALQNKLD